MCMCATSQCNQEGTDNGSTCFLLCRIPRRDESSGICLPVTSESRRCPWVGGRCTCEVCSCTCNKKFKLSDYARISHLGMNPNAARDNDSAPGETRAFLSNMISVGATAAVQADEDGDDADELFNDNFASSTADAIGRIGPNSLSSGALRVLQRGLSRSTTVTLPNGERYDTRRITENPNAHAQNNRLPGSSVSASRPGAAPGMLDGLNLDYSDLSASWQQAAAGYSGSVISEMMRQGPSALSFEEQERRAMADSLAEANAGKTDEDDPALKQAIINSQIDWGVYSAPATSNGGTVDLLESDNDGGGKQPPQQPPLDGNRVDLTHSDWSASSLSAPSSRSGSSGASAPKKSGGERIFHKLRSGNLQKMHSMTDKSALTKEMKSERKDAKKRKKLMNGLAASPNTIGTDMALAMGVPGSDISRFADGAVTAPDGAECDIESLTTAFDGVYGSDTDSD